MHIRRLLIVIFILLSSLAVAEASGYFPCDRFFISPSEAAKASGLSRLEIAAVQSEVILKRAVELKIQATWEQAIVIALTGREMGLSDGEAAKLVTRIGQDFFGADLSNAIAILEDSRELNVSPLSHAGHVRSLLRGIRGEFGEPIAKPSFEQARALAYLEDEYHLGEEGFSDLLVACSELGSYSATEDLLEVVKYVLDTRAPVGVLTLFVRTVRENIKITQIRGGIPVTRRLSTASALSLYSVARREGWNALEAIERFRETRIGK